MLVAEKVAVMVWEPEPTETGVTVTTQPDISPELGGIVQVPLNISPGSDEVTATVPVGADFVPPAWLSTTSTYTELSWPGTTDMGSSSSTYVMVERLFTVSVAASDVAEPQVPVTTTS